MVVGLEEFDVDAVRAGGGADTPIAGAERSGSAANPIRGDGRSRVAEVPTGATGATGITDGVRKNPVSSQPVSTPATSARIGSAHREMRDRSRRAAGAALRSAPSPPVAAVASLRRSVGGSGRRIRSSSRLDSDKNHVAGASARGGADTRGENPAGLRAGPASGKGAGAGGTQAFPPVAFGASRCGSLSDHGESATEYRSFV